MSTTELTPLMKQYHEIKACYTDTLLLFQVGDFYELFFDDAKQAAAFLGIALTARGKNKGEPIPLCGVPVHARDYYLNKLIKGGFKVALCDQLEEAKPGTVVQRGVTQVLTPGTLIDPQLLDEKSASYLCSLFPAQDSWALLFGELLTAQLYATTIPATDRSLESELARFFPDEIVLPHTAHTGPIASYLKQRGYFTTVVSFDHTNELEEQAVNGWIKAQFQPDIVSTLHNNEALRLALYYFYAYIKRNQAVALTQFNQLHVYRADNFLMLDAATQRNLELIKNMHDGSTKNTLFSVMDHAVTPMGSRMIKKWILRPLVNQQAIAHRLDVVSLLVHDVVLTQQLVHCLSKIGDIERVIGRIALGKATVYDYSALARALRIMPDIQVLLMPKMMSMMLCQIIHDHLSNFDYLTQLLGAALNEDTTIEYIIKKGFDIHLDELRQLNEQSHLTLIDLERKEQARTGITSLKVRYNQVQGYYIEVTKANLDSVPENYVRQQTLTGRERYTTVELQQLAHAIMQAKQNVDQVEKVVFERIKHAVGQVINPLRKLAYAIAQLDALLGFAQTAYNYNYVRPMFNDDHILAFVNGRHPVVEQHTNNIFIPNDTHMHNDAALWIITGPNMGGKSTYLRQVALIEVLAHCGSFVPAQQANVAILDRIFTRIGAGDNVAEGKSTFLIEMEETAAICMQATRNSLIILDEVGRGTSTFDGLALAQAIVEYLHTQVQARCLFATHYHELTALCSIHAGIVSYYAASKKTAHGIIFLHKIIAGIADGSFGIEVAQLAQIPPIIIERARTLLDQLHKNDGKTMSIVAIDAIKAGAENIDLKRQGHVIAEHDLVHYNAIMAVLHSLDYNELSPKQALDVLWKIKESIS